MGLLEQVGHDYKAFISYLLKNKPAICINIEPIAEVLDANKLIDNLAIKYFRKRNYLNGYLDYLKKLEKQNKITITEIKRTYIGSMFAECYFGDCMETCKKMKKILLYSPDTTDEKYLQEV